MNLSMKPNKASIVNRSFIRRGLALGISCLLATGAHADDTEIYTQTDALSVNPNVLFVIDTSGSMAEEEEISTFDPSVTYTVPGGSTACLDTRLYVGGIGGNNHPGCGTDYWFEKSKFRCEASKESLGYDPDAPGSPPTGNVTGFYNDRYAQWDNNYENWYTLDSTFDNYRNQSGHYECQDDHNRHGESDGDSADRIRNGNSGPWSQSGSNNWRNFDSRTVFTGNYLNWYHYHGGSSGATKTRLEIVVKAAKDMIDSVSNMNIGLMRFDTKLERSPDGYYRNNLGGPISHGVLDVSPGEQTAGEDNKEILKDVLDTFSTSGSTPLTETVWEGMRYFRGEQVVFGLDSEPSASHASSRTGNSYDSPIGLDCQTNYMVVFSDGAPTDDRDADNAINDLVSGTPGDMGSCEFGNDYDSPDDSCLDELANYMFNADHATDAIGNDLAGKQNITSYYISGFNAADDALMDSAAVRGGTKHFYSASNPSEFAAVFNTIVSEIQQVNASFTSPAVSVNALNRLKNNNELYFALFEPSRSPHWNGNIKKYILADSGNVDADGEPELVIADSTGVSAVDETTGLFKSTARSFWELPDVDPDGDKTARGGSAHRLYDYNAATETHDASSRGNRVYTYLTDYAPDSAEFDGSGIALVDLADSLVDMAADPSPNTEDGVHVTAGTLGLSSPTTPQDLLDRVRWMRGVDVLDSDQDGNTNEGRNVMGGILHTEPVLVNYSVDDKGTADEDDDEQINVILTTTNDGYFHLFKTVDSGTERLEHSAVIPKKTLGQMERLYNDSGSDVEHRLDSNIDVWRYDHNKDDAITTGGNDFVYAYFGQRRGGNAIFAFDITNPAIPKLLWQIDPDTISGAETDASLAPFKRIGETWSRPRRHSILVPNSGNNGLERQEILIFGGGYDSTRDDIEDIARDEDQFGNAIYIVDAKTGELIWWTSNDAENGVSPNLVSSDMKYGFPSNLRIIDINGDGIADKIFASDAGGQVWRFDINNNLNVGDTLSLDARISGGVIADLQLEDNTDTPSDTNNRRLYYAPDVAIIQEEDSSTPQLSISIGSGYRAHPLNKTVSDKFFVLKYDQVLGIPASYSSDKIYLEDLLNITNLNLADQAVADALSAADRAKLDNNGWLIDLEDEGEKSLSESITVDGNVVFTTFTPPGSSNNAGGQECEGSQGAAKTYVVSVFDGAPVANLDGIGADNDLTTSDRIYNNKVPGIAPEPKTIFPDIDGVDTGRIIVGRELLPLKIDNNPELTYWVQE